MAVGVRQQSEEARALHSGRKLALILRFSARNTAWNNLAGFGDISLQRIEILVINLFNALGGETTKLTTTKKRAIWYYSLNVRALGFSVGFNSRCLFFAIVSCVVVITTRLLATLTVFIAGLTLAALFLGLHDR